MQIYLAVKGFLMPVKVEDISEFEDQFIKFMHTNYPDVGSRIKETKQLGEEDETILKKAVEEFMKLFGAKHELIKEEE